jgi:hypothetical protein
MKTLAISLIIMTIFSFPVKDKLTGRWETRPSQKGNVTGIVFKEDKSFEAYVNRKPFASGKYTLQDSVFTFTDTGCEGKPGTYIPVFFSGNDSLRFEVVSDSCLERQNGMKHIVLGRVK